MENEHATDNNSSLAIDSTARSPSQTRRCVYHFLLPSKNGDHVLAEVDGNGVAKLPTMELPAGVDLSDRCVEDTLGRGIEAVCGPSVYVVRLLSMEQRMKGFDCVGNDYLCLGDVLDAKPMLLKPFEWIPRDEACAMDWTAMNGEGLDEHIRTEVKRSFREKNGETSLTNFRPWRNIGWFGEITAWCQKLLEARKIVMTGRIRQQSRTVQSVVMSCDVKMRGKRKLEGSGDSCELIFIKSTIPAVREAQRTVTIAAVIGNIVPQILGFEERKGLLMMRNGGSVTDEPFDQEALIDTVLEIQKLSMSRINELDAGGVSVRDSEWVESKVESILNHELLDTYCEWCADMSDDAKEVVDTVRAKVGLIQKRCRKITKLDLPSTLVHGDLIEDNIGSPLRIDGKVYRIFDWATSFIGNPLHDFETLFPWRRGGVYSKNGEFSINLDAAMEQISQVWKACGTLPWEEMKTVFETLNAMSSIIRIHDLIEEYEWGDNNHERDVVIMGELREHLEDVMEQELK